MCCVAAIMVTLQQLLQGVMASPVQGGIGHGISMTNSLEACVAA
jgi:hypothetical protein